MWCLPRENFGQGHRSSLSLLPLQASKDCALVACVDVWYCVVQCSGKFLRVYHCLHFRAQT